MKSRTADEWKAYFQTPEYQLNAMTQQRQSLAYALVDTYRELCKTRAERTGAKMALQFQKRYVTDLQQQRNNAQKLAVDLASALSLLRHRQERTINWNEDVPSIQQIDELLGRAEFLHIWITDSPERE